MDKVRFLLITKLTTLDRLVVAIQDDDTYNRCKDFFNRGEVTCVDIVESSVRGLLASNEGIGVGVYLDDPTDPLGANMERAEALHRYVVLIHLGFNEINLAEPISLKPVGFIDRPEVFA